MECFHSLIIKRQEMISGWACFRKKQQKQQHQVSTLIPHCSSPCCVILTSSKTLQGPPRYKGPLVPSISYLQQKLSPSPSLSSKEQTQAITN